MIRIHTDMVKSELIDTLWNVNLNQGANAMSSAARINRYIMECK